jgi:small subunit ribosomal protein S16
MVRIRLKKTGAKNWISFRIVATEMRTARDGKVLQELGYYDPRRSDEKIDVAATEGWVSKGAQMTETVADILKRAKEGKSKVRGAADGFTKKKSFKKGDAAKADAAKAEAAQA